MLARLMAYVGALALLAILGVHLWDQLPEIADAEPAAEAGWSEASRSHPAFAVSQFDSSDKTESYEILRHPEGGRKDILRWGTPGEWPVAELEIYRPGAEPGQSGPAMAEIAERMSSGGRSEPEAAGVIDSKFGMVTLLRLAGTAGGGRALPWLRQASRRARSADLRLVMPGGDLAGAARRDLLRAEPADAADGRKRPETG